MKPRGYSIISEIHVVLVLLSLVLYVATSMKYTEIFYLDLDVKFTYILIYVRVIDLAPQTYTYPCTLDGCVHSPVARDFLQKYLRLQQPFA